MTGQCSPILHCSQTKAQTIDIPGLSSLEAIWNLFFPRTIDFTHHWSWRRITKTALPTASGKGLVINMLLVRVLLG